MHYSPQLAQRISVQIKNGHTRVAGRICILNLSLYQACKAYTMPPSYIYNKRADDQAWLDKRDFCMYIDM